MSKQNQYQQQQQQQYQDQHKHQHQAIKHNRNPSPAHGTTGDDCLIGDELQSAISHMVANISKSFIVEWYTSISPTNHDFVASCETLIEKALTKLAQLCIKRVDKYKLGQLVVNLLHQHILNDESTDKIFSIEGQIQEHEYDICQNAVVRLFGIICTPELRRVIFTELTTNPQLNSHLMSRTSSSHFGGSSSQNSQRSNTDDDSYPMDSDCYQNQLHNPNSSTGTKTTSALYTLVIAMLTKAVFMQIVNSISEPRWLYAVIIWLCKKEERDRFKKKAVTRKLNNDTPTDYDHSGYNQISDIRNRFQGSSNSLQATSVVVTPTRYSSVSRSVDLEEGIDMASGNINFDNPVCDSLKRPLDNIEIYATEEVKGNNSCYVLYCISYDGIYYRHPSAGFSFIPENSEIPIIDKRSTNITSRRLGVNHKQQTSHLTGPSTSGNPNKHLDPNARSFRRRMSIKRRFREFVILQLRLEENPKIRPYMKNIPKPTKLKAATQNIFSLPGITNIKLDQSTIKLRQRFLERFLIALNNSPFIANSYEFKEFFSYNTMNSPAMHMSKSKSLILQVNLNKVFVDSVRSAYSIIRSTLPGDNYQLGSTPNPDAWLTELQQSTLKLHVQTRTSHSKMNLERYLDSKLLCLNDSPTRTCKSSSLGSYYKGNAYLSANNCTDTSSGYGGSLQSKRNIPSMFPSRSLSSDSSTSTSRSSSMESVYHDAPDVFETTRELNEEEEEKRRLETIKICDSVPIASKLIEILHYSVSKNVNCADSNLTFLARLLMGNMIERQAIGLLERYINLENAAKCINGITSSIWDESDDPPLDLENAGLEEAVLHLSKLLDRNYTSTSWYPIIPKQLINSFISKEIKFFLSQLSSQRRNKFVIYSFFVRLLDELEVLEQHP